MMILCGLWFFRSMHYYVIIPAAGIGKRFSSTLPKQYWNLGGKPILSRVIDFFLEFSFVDRLVVAVSPHDMHWTQMNFCRNSRVITVLGGDDRARSVLNALQALENTAEKNNWVLVHDACRPLLERKLVLNLIDSSKDHPVGGIVGIPVRDTLKRVDENLTVLESVDRNSLWQAQTPQMFRYGVLYESLSNAIERGILVTDEAMALERADLKVKMVEGSFLNIKITWPEDLTLAETILEKKHESRTRI